MNYPPVLPPGDAAFTRAIDALMAASASTYEVVAMSRPEMMAKEYAPDEVAEMEEVHRQNGFLRSRLGSLIADAHALRARSRDGWTKYQKRIIGLPQPHPVTSDFRQMERLVERAKIEGPDATDAFLRAAGMGPHGPDSAQWTVELVARPGTTDTQQLAWMPVLIAQPAQAPGDLVQPPNHTPATTEDDDTDAAATGQAAPPTAAATPSDDGIQGAS